MAFCLIGQTLAVLAAKTRSRLPGRAGASSAPVGGTVMLNLGEYRSSADRLADHLPWAALVAPGIVLNKDGSFQRTLRFRGPDLDSATEAELVGILRPGQQCAAPSRLRLGAVLRGGTGRGPALPALGLSRSGLVAGRRRTPRRFRRCKARQAFRESIPPDTSLYAAPRRSGAGAERPDGDRPERRRAELAAGTGRVRQRDRPGAGPAVRIHARGPGARRCRDL